MKKINHILFALIGLSAFFASCDRPMTYAERLRYEERAIDRFFSEKNFTRLSSFPSDTIFPADAFFQDPATGVYFNIEDRGDLNNRIDVENHRGRELYVRFRGLNFFTMPSDTILHSNDQALNPIIMEFQGPVTRQTRFLYSDGVPAFIVPLQHIGHNGRVRMIVPFHMGGTFERQGFHTTFYDQVDFRFELGRPWTRSEEE